MEGRQIGLLSVVAPVHNEQESLREFYTRVSTALAGITIEIILVDDGSTDASSDLLDELARSDPRVKVLHLSRNFGHQPALTAGLDHAAGDAVVMLDADLQDPPEVILEMLERWRSGADVVYAVRGEREGESYFKLRTAALFYKLFDRLSTVPFKDQSGDFRLLDRTALNALLSMRETSRFLRGMTVWIGYTQASVVYRREARYAGRTKFTLPRMLRFSMDALTSFSNRPLQVATLLGFVISCIAFLAIPLVIVLKALGHYLPGFSTVEITMLLLGGIQLTTIGVVGEYVGRVFDEVKGRPLYLVRARRNFPPRPAAAGSQAAGAPTLPMPVAAPTPPAPVAGDQRDQPDQPDR
ncbi:MAG: glycosyltransferase family 2 protein [Solirubrobacteraceae bacterium]